LGLWGSIARRRRAPRATRRSRASSTSTCCTCAGALSTLPRPRIRGVLPTRHARGRVVNHAAKRHARGRVPRHADDWMVVDGHARGRVLNHAAEPIYPVYNPFCLISRSTPPPTSSHACIHADLCMISVTMSTQAACTPRALKHALPFQRLAMWSFLLVLGYTSWYTWAHCLRLSTVVIYASVIYAFWSMEWSLWLGLLERGNTCALCFSLLASSVTL
jgi:hypothetical protein